MLAALDRTGTPMGARRLRDWILHPLRELEPLRARQDVIEALIAQPFILTKCRETLKDIRDIERTLGRLNQAGNARDMQVLGQSLKRCRTSARTSKRSAAGWRWSPNSRRGCAISTEVTGPHRAGHRG